MKLQKLVYFAHGWFLALTHHLLVAETVEAWPYGPVIPELYHKFKQFGNEPITELACEGRMVGGKAGCFYPSITDIPAPDGEEARQVIERVWKLYGGFSSARLSNATHVEDSPWHQVYQQGQRSVDIPNDIIQAYFSKMADGSGKAA